MSTYRPITRWTKRAYLQGMAEARDIAERARWAANPAAPSMGPELGAQKVMVRIVNRIRELRREFYGGE